MINNIVKLADIFKILRLLGAKMQMGRKYENK